MTQTNLSTVQRQAGSSNSSNTTAIAERLWAERSSSNAAGTAAAAAAAAGQQSSTGGSVSRRYTFHTAADGGSVNRGRSSRGGSIVTSLAQVRQEVERTAGAYQRGEKLPDRPPPTPPQAPPPPPRQPQPQQQPRQNVAAAPDLAASTAPAATGGGGGQPTSAAAAIATSNSSSTAGATVTSPRNPYSSGSSNGSNNNNKLGGSGAEGNVRHKEDRDRCRALLVGSSSANGGAKSNTSNDDGVIEIGDDDEYDTGPIQFDYGSIGGSGGGGDVGGGGGSAPTTSGRTSSSTYPSAPPPTFAPSTLNWHTESANDGGNHGSGTGGGNDTTFDDDMFASLDVDAIVSQHQAKKQMHHQPAPSQQRYPNQGGGGGGGGYQSQGYSADSGGHNGSSANPYGSASYGYEGAASGYGNVTNNYGGGSNNSSSYGGGGGGFGDDFGAAGHMSLYGGGGGSESSNNGGSYQQNGGGYGNDGYGDFGGSSSGWGNSAGCDSYGGGPSSWGGGGTNHMSSIGGDGSAPLCSGHGVPCRLLTASTAQNSGRQFYKCSLPEGEQCDFFEWADGMEGSLNPAAAVQGAEIKDMHTESRRKFGHHSFRVGQEGIIRNALQGRDVFVLMPTGGGKSLCYQLPAWCAPGLSVVVSPLLSLIQDQVQSMTKLGVESVFLSSAQDWETQRSQVVARIRNVTPHGGVKLLYITPEMLNRSGMMKGILSNLCKKKLISRFVVDEGKYNCDYCGRIGRICGWSESFSFHAHIAFLISF